MHPLLIKVLDYIFPPSADQTVVHDFTSEMMHKKYALRNNNGVWSLTPYSDIDIRAIVHEAKFHGNKKAFMLLGTLLKVYLGEQTQPFDTIIPLPLSSSRLRARGYNQVWEILKTQEADALDTLDTTSLLRIRNTRPQTELERSARLLNMHNAFSVKNSGAITRKHILIVDDVTTTGATLQSAKASLLPYNPASITLLAIAH